MYLDIIWHMGNARTYGEECLVLLQLLREKKCNSQNPAAFIGYECQ